MATFAQLKTDVADLTGQSNVSGSVKLLTELAQSKLKRIYSPRFLYRSVTLLPVGQTFILPADLFRIHAMRLWATSGASLPMTEVPESHGRRSQSALGVGTPLTNSSEVTYWREVQNLCHFVGTVDTTHSVELDYVVDDALPVNDADTNLWLTYAYDILLQAVCAEVMTYMGDEKRSQSYTGAYMNTFRNMQRNDVADEVSGRTLLLKGGYDA